MITTELIYQFILITLKDIIIYFIQLTCIGEISALQTGRSVQKLAKKNNSANTSPILSSL